jgi:hypothetical protein
VVYAFVVTRHVPFNPSPAGTLAITSGSLSQPLNDIRFKRSGDRHLRLLVYAEDDHIKPASFFKNQNRR